MSNTTNNCRRYQRVDTRFPVTLLVGDEEVSCEVTDVSFSGLFIVCEELPSARSIIKLAIDVEDGQGPLHMLLMVARVLDPRENPACKRKGVGCSFFGNSREDMQRWENFVRDVLSQEAPSSSTTAASNSNRLLAEVPITIESVEGLTNLVREHEQLGHFFITCDRVLPQGSPVRLVFEFSGKGNRFAMTARVLGRRNEDDVAMAVEPLEAVDVLAPRVKAFLATVRGRTLPGSIGNLIEIAEGAEGKAIASSIPVLGDTEGIVFTGLVTEELLLVEDFMDDLFSEVI